MASESIAPWVLLCRGVAPVDSAPPAAVFLKSSVPGAYTTTRTGNQGECLLLWQRNLSRLAHSMHILSLAMPDRFPRPPPTVLDLVRPPLQVGLRRALELRRSGEEVSVTVLVSPEPAGALSWHASVHLSSYSVAPLAVARVAVLGPGRDLPLAKYSAWARAREPLEQAKPAGATEIVLSNDGDGLLEGSVTNFFVVAMKSQSEMEVQTASLEDGVLPGVIRQLVIEVCQEDGIPLREVMPSWQARATWKEAFVTSGLRMVQPVESIRARPGESCLDEWTKLQLSASGSLTQHIRNRVLQRAVEEGTPISELLRS